MKILLAGILTSILFLTSANATTIIPLDTFPAAGTPFSTSLPVYASFEWQELAIPFHIPAAGKISQIDTALFYSFGLTPLVVGIARAPLVGQPFPDSVFSQTICSNVPDTDSAGFNFCQQDNPQSVNLTPGELFSWSGDLFLDSGDYWLYGSVEGDLVFGGWYTNPDILRDDWATRSCALGILQGKGCVFDAATWASVAEFGPVRSIGGTVSDGGAHATPIARIQFEVPEPASLFLMALGLITLARVAKSRKDKAAQTNTRLDRKESDLCLIS